MPVALDMSSFFSQLPWNSEFAQPRRQQKREGKTTHTGLHILGRVSLSSLSFLVPLACISSLCESFCCLVILSLENKVLAPIDSLTEMCFTRHPSSFRLCSSSDFLTCSGVSPLLLREEINTGFSTRAMMAGSCSKIFLSPFVGFFPLPVLVWETEEVELHQAGTCTELFFDKSGCARELLRGGGWTLEIDSNDLLTGSSSLTTQWRRPNKVRTSILGLDAFAGLWTSCARFVI